MDKRKVNYTVKMRVHVQVKGGCLKRSNVCLTLMVCVYGGAASVDPDYVMWKQKVAPAQNGELAWLVALQ